MSSPYWVLSGTAAVDGALLRKHRWTSNEGGQVFSLFRGTMDHVHCCDHYTLHHYPNNQSNGLPGNTASAGARHDYITAVIICQDFGFVPR